MDRAPQLPTYFVRTDCGVDDLEEMFYRMVGLRRLQPIHLQPRPFKRGMARVDRNPRAGGNADEERIVINADNGIDPPPLNLETDLQPQPEVELEPEVEQNLEADPVSEIEPVPEPAVVAVPPKDPAALSLADLLDAAAAVDLVEASKTQVMNEEDKAAGIGLIQVLGAPSIPLLDNPDFKNARASSTKKRSMSFLLPRPSKAYKRRNASVSMKAKAEAVSVSIAQEDEVSLVPTKTHDGSFCTPPRPSKKTRCFD